MQNGVLLGFAHRAIHYRRRCSREIVSTVKKGLPPPAIAKRNAGDLHPASRGPVANGMQSSFHSVLAEAKSVDPASRKRPARVSLEAEPELGPDRIPPAVRIVDIPSLRLPSADEKNGGTTSSKETHPDEPNYPCR